MRSLKFPFKKKYGFLYNYIEKIKLKKERNLEKNRSFGFKCTCFNQFRSHIYQNFFT